MNKETQALKTKDNKLSRLSHATFSDYLMMEAKQSAPGTADKYDSNPLRLTVKEK